MQTLSSPTTGTFYAYSIRHADGHETSYHRDTPFGTLAKMVREHGSIRSVTRLDEAGNPILI